MSFRSWNPGARQTQAARAFTLALLLAFLAIVAVFAIEVPYLTGRVVDDANILRPETRTRLTEMFKTHEEATSNQVVVLTVPTIQPDSIEDYAVKVFESWKLGQKGKDNGVLVVVVPQDRKMRIEVGYGLEPILTDGAAGQIIRSVMTPKFKAGDYDGGIEDGARAIVARLEGRDQSPNAGQRDSSSPDTVRFDVPQLAWMERILTGAFVFGIIGLFTVIGVLTPGAGWFLYVFLIPFWAMFPVVIIGTRATVALLFAYLFGYPMAKILIGRTEWYGRAVRDLKSKGVARIGGFTFGSSRGSSGFSSGGGFSGGGFSGGGGGSGGGGSSGSW